MAFKRFAPGGAAAAPALAPAAPAPVSAPPAAVAPAPVAAAAPVAPPAPTAVDIQKGIDAAKAALDALNSGDVKTAEIIQAAPIGADLSTLFADGLGISASALTAFIGVADEPAGPPMKFPVVNLTSGNGAGAGAFSPADWVDKEFGAGTSNLLPAGKRPLTAVFLGYRIELIAWSVAFDDPSRKKDDRPAWSCAVPANDASTIQVATEACKNYQFTKKSDKGAFDYAHSKAGHVRPAVQVLVFVPNVGIIVLAPPMHYSSVERTLKSLGKQADQQSGSLKPFPALIEPKTQGDKTATQSWLQHHLEFSLSVGADAKEAWDQFNEWRLKVLPSDVQVQADIREFLNGTDHPVTPEIRQSLTVAAAL